MCQPHSSLPTGAQQTICIARTCSVLEYSKSDIFSADRGLSDASIRLCSRTCARDRGV